VVLPQEQLRVLELQLLALEVLQLVRQLWGGMEV
jgi:hypothetical protein